MKIANLPECFSLQKSHDKGDNGNADKNAQLISQERNCFGNDDGNDDCCKKQKNCAYNCVKLVAGWHATDKIDFTKDKVFRGQDESGMIFDISQNANISRETVTRAPSVKAVT